MRLKTVDNIVFFGMLLILLYQYALLYLSIFAGTWENFVMVAGAFLLGLFLGRTTYIILASALSFVCVSVGLLLLILHDTRQLYFWGAIALISITPLTAYLMYLLDHRLMKRQALHTYLQKVQRDRPELDVITGAYNGFALDQALRRELALLADNHEDYRITLTMVKIDFLENVVNFLGNDHFNDLLRGTARQLEVMLFTVDRLYYIGSGKFVIKSPLLDEANARLLRRKLKAHINEIGGHFGLARNGLVLRIGQISSTQERLEDYHAEEIIANLERSAETDIVKEYI